MTVLNKEQVGLEVALTNKPLSQIAGRFHVSVAGLTNQLNRILFMVTLCWNGENHVFYRYSKTRGQALQQAKRALEKKLGLAHKSLGAKFHMEFESIVKITPCICYTCRHQKDKACPENGDVSALHYCTKWENKR